MKDTNMLPCLAFWWSVYAVSDWVAEWVTSVGCRAVSFALCGWSLLFHRHPFTFPKQSEIVTNNTRIIRAGHRRVPFSAQQTKGMDYDIASQLCPACNRPPGLWKINLLSRNEGISLLHGQKSDGCQPGPCK